MFNSIKNKIKGKKLILFGEIHGTKEIPNLIEEFLIDIAKEEDFDLCLEIPEEFQKNINEFFEQGNENKLKEISFFSKPYNQDGRGSLEYLNLIKKIYEINIEYNKNIKIFCIDSDANNQEEKEQLIASNIIKVLKNKKIFVILGEVHASKGFISLYEKRFLPAGAILFNKLKNKMFSIRILPTKGRFFNFGVKEISENDLNDSINNNFDYVFKIGNVTPGSFK